VRRAEIELHSVLKGGHSNLAIQSARRDYAVSHGCRNPVDDFAACGHRDDQPANQPK
jgi:hypothetical protein